MQKRGDKLRVGDTIEVWWSSNTVIPNRDTIVRIDQVSKTLPSYKKMLEVFPEGYAFARFLSGAQMTIDFSDYYHMDGPSIKDLSDPSFH